MAIITGKVVSQTPVYFGPNTSTYPSNNSYAGPNDTVTVFWKENSFYYIEYPAGSKKKRMYIRAAAVSAISGTVSDFVPCRQQSAHHRHLRVLRETYVPTLAPVTVPTPKQVLLIMAKQFLFLIRRKTAMLLLNTRFPVE